MIRLRVDPRGFDASALEAAVRALRSGGVVAYPTETFYGLAVDPRQAFAVTKLFTLKRRSPDQPIPLIASDVQQVIEQVGTMTPLATTLAARGWPGPLTLLIPASDQLTPDVHVSTGLAAVRVPADSIARALAGRAGHAVTSTSANISGEPPVTAADDLDVRLLEGIDVVIDGGPTPGGLASTIVDATGMQPRLLRAGAIPWGRVLEFLN
jgi:L-threonylcarbamoyladenylate synthase